MEPSAAWTTLAQLLRPQGRKGEILGELLTDFPEHFTTRPGLTLRHPDGKLEAVAVESYWLPVGRNAGRVVLKLQGVDSIEAAERLAASDLLVAEDRRIALPEDEAQYIDDLIDCKVLDHGRSIGIVQEVQFPVSSTGAHLEDAAPLLVVHSPAGSELLIPFAKVWIDSIDIPAKVLTMRLPEGLLDINA